MKQLFSPVSEEIEYTLQHFDELDIIKRTAGVETYSGYIKYSRKYDETWAGFGFSYKVNDQLYLGLSSFLYVKLLKYEFRQQAKTYQKGDSVDVRKKSATWIRVLSTMHGASIVCQKRIVCY